MPLSVRECLHIAGDALASSTDAWQRRLRWSVSEVRGDDGAGAAASTSVEHTGGVQNAAPVGPATSGSTHSMPPLVHVRCVESRDRRLSDSVQQYASVGSRAFFMQEDPAIDAGQPSTSVYLLTDRFQSSAELRKVLQHEMIHVHDAVVHGWDLRVLAHLSCSELRAASHVDCRRKWPPFLRSRCVLERAQRSTGFVFGAGSEPVVEALYDWCANSNISANPVAAGPLADAIAASSAVPHRE